MMNWQELLGWGMALLTLLLLGVIGTALLRASSESVRALGESAKDAGKGAGDLLQGGGVGAGALLQGTGHALIGLGTGLGAVAGGLGQAVGGVLKGAGGGLGTLLTGTVPLLATLGRGATHTIRSTLSQGAATTKRGVRAAAQRTQRAVPHIKAAARSAAQAGAVAWTQATQPAPPPPAAYAWNISDPAIATFITKTFQAAGVVYQWQQHHETGEWSIVVWGDEGNLEAAAEALDVVGLEIREPGQPAAWFAEEVEGEDEATNPDVNTWAPTETPEPTYVNGQYEGA
jgi:hypothetical protein